MLLRQLFHLQLNAWLKAGTALGHGQRWMQMQLPLQLQLPLLMQLLLHFGIDSIRVATQKRNLKFSWLPFGPWTYVANPHPATAFFSFPFPFAFLWIASAICLFEKLALPTRVATPGCTPCRRCGCTRCV